jgi:alanyl-tRNA synthetase
MITQQKIIDKFFQFTLERGYDRKERSNLISPHFENEFNLSAGHQYVIPKLLNHEKDELIKIAINETCIRRIDLEKLGVSAHHLLLFEMGVMGLFGYIDNLKETLSTTIQDFLDIIVFLGFDLNDIYLSVSDGAIVLHEHYPADILSYEVLVAKGIKESHLIKTKGRQNFIFSNGVGRPAGNSIEVFYKKNDNFTEIASVNIYKFLFSNGKLNTVTNQAIGGGFGFDRITYLLNGHPTVFDIPPFSTFVAEIKSLFRNEMEFKLNKDRIYRIIELIKTLLFIQEEAQLPESPHHEKIMKSFVSKLKSEIGFLELKEENVMDIGIPIIQKHYSLRYKWKKHGDL